MVRFNALKGLYDVEKTIGCGGFAKVKLATHLATGEKVAIKIMNKELLGEDLPRVKQELKALKTLSHEHICKLYQVIETETHFFLVMEYCSGGELFDHIVEKNRLNETESRMFFKQIVSAVAYLHSLGYAHRDLKPENVLLDKDQNLKLIDFGLCARPEGGMNSPLFTSCGSPTYAAPELVLGKKYLGPEVDVWAMGVLLYALLAGFLPFDDTSIDSLYKKILSGKYEEPNFMSKESRALIRQMLQVDPKKRITVNQLLCHPWLTMKILEPVQFQSEYSKHYDEDIVPMMAKMYNASPENMWNHLKRWKYDYHTATYLLLLAKKKRGLPLKLLGINVKVPLRIRLEDAQKTPLKTRNKNTESSTEKSAPLKNELCPPNVPLLKTKKLFLPDAGTPGLTPKKDISNLSFPKTPKNNIELTVMSPCGAFLEPSQKVGARKTQKRVRSPTFDAEASPVPSKKQSISTDPSTPSTPDQKVTSENTGSARRVLGSIERSLHKVRHVLTPRKMTSASDSALQPLLLTGRDLCNVSTTQYNDPEFVINELTKALQKKGINCNRKGFRLRGKLDPNPMQRLGGCSFELEICFLPTLGSLSSLKNASTPTKSILKNGPLNSPVSANSVKSNISAKLELSSLENGVQSYVGIRRKRLKGDSWCYKKVCEQVLALTSTDLSKGVTESSV